MLGVGGTAARRLLLVILQFLHPNIPYSYSRCHAKNPSDCATSVFNANCNILQAARQPALAVVRSRSSTPINTAIMFVPQQEVNI